MKTNPYPGLTDAVTAMDEGVKLKLTPIPDGHVRIERASYGYGQQGQTWLQHYDIRDVPEFNAIHWLNGQFVYVTWPDRAIEMYDLAVTPCRIDSAIRPSFGEIPGITGHVKLSRLPNVAFDYYRAITINADQRAAFVPYNFE
jgi:hypothetical protein